MSQILLPRLQGSGVVLFIDALYCHDLSMLFALYWMHCHSPATVPISPEHLCWISVRISVRFFLFFLPPPTATMLQMIWKDQLGCFAEYVCESCLDLMASSDIHCQDHKKVRRFTSSGCLRHDFISCCLWVVTLELTEGEPFLMNTGCPEKANRPPLLFFLSELCDINRVCSNKGQDLSWGSIYPWIRILQFEFYLLGFIVRGAYMTITVWLYLITYA